MSERIRVIVTPVVQEYVRTLAPEARKAVRAGIRGLERGQGDIKPLEDTLAGLNRLRVGAHRVVFFYKVEADGQQTVICAYAEHRSVVYLMLESIMTAGLRLNDKP